MHVQPVRLTEGRYQRTTLGVLASLGGLGIVLAILLPLRSHVSIVVPALLFVLPALLGVVLGGFVPGAVGALGGFFFYDYFFLPPYNTLTVSPENWVALLVYVVVVLVVAQVVTQLQRARQDAMRRTEETRRLYELSQALIGDLNLSQLLMHIVESVQSVFTPRSTALILPAGGRGALAPGEVLQVAASAGEPLTDGDISALTTGGGRARSLGMTGGTEPRRVSVALAVGDHPVGLLVLQEVELAGRERSLLGAFANQAALALDRAELSEQALRTRVLEEIDRWRSALMGAASHDLRTPLASMKTAVSSLRQVGAELDPADRDELLELIELQSDRLARLVTNLLDMTRIEAGALELRPVTLAFDELVSEAIGSLEGILGPGRVVVDASTDLPLLRIDHVLISQVLANLLENADRASPEDSTIRVAGRVAPEPASTLVEISVSDDGPGIGIDERGRVFEMFSQNAGGGRAGLGLAIAKAFVEAHGGHIWIDPDVAGGTRIVFTVPIEAAVPAGI